MVTAAKASPFVTPPIDKVGLDWALMSVEAKNGVTIRHPVAGGG